MRNPIDALIELAAPRLGEARYRARRRLDAYRAQGDQVRAYEGASKTRRTAGWLAPGTSAVGETEFQLDTLRFRSRDLVRNNPHAAEAVRIWARHAIGPGFRVTPRGRARENKRAADLWKEWADSTQCDPLGRSTIDGLSSLGMREVVESGEFLIRRRWRRGDEGLAVPLQLQLLEVDHLDTTKRLEGREVNKSRVIQGIQFSNRGRVQGYWIFPFHPGDTYSLRRPSVFVPARDVIHVFRTERIGQVRGLPWGTPAMIRHRKLDQFEDAELERKQIASMFVGFVHDIEAGMGDKLTTGSIGTDLALEPGTWEELPHGKDITFSKPPESLGYAPFVEITLRSIARAYSVSYEDLTGDLSKVNFNSARVGRMEHADEVRDWQRHTWRPVFCDRVWAWFLEAAAVAGKLGFRPIPAEWTAPPPRVADPKTETQVATMRIRSGLSSLSAELRERGLDPQETLQELAADLENLDRLGLTLDSDPRTSTSSGAARTDAGAGEVGDQGGGAAQDDPTQGGGATGEEPETPAFEDTRGLVATPDTSAALLNGGDRGAH